MNKRSLVLFVALFYVLQGCAGPAPSNAQVDSGPPSAQIGYPIAESPEAKEGRLENAYPSQSSTSDPEGLQSTDEESGPPGILPEAPDDAPAPADEKGSMRGLLFSVTNRTIIPNTKVYLTPAMGENGDVPNILVGPASDEVILQSNEYGIVEADNIEPGDYYLVMSAPPYDWEVGYEDVQTAIPLKIQIATNEKTVLGIIYISWP